MDYCQTGLLVVQPTPFCNIDCSYCYLPHRSVKKQLSFESAEIVFKKLLSFPTVRDAITIVWHAGEPLVLPTTYYERMFELVKGVAPPDLQICHSLQTNGTLITEEWCAFIKKWDINIGVSIDGPRDLHDIYRKQRNGKGSFERAYQGLRTLQRAGVPFHVISVLTVESMQEPEKLLEFYVENGVEYVCFNIEEQEGANTRSRLVESMSPGACYRSFLERFNELAMERQQYIGIREVDSSLRAIQGHGKPVRNEQTEPFRIISVDCEGNVSTFSPELLGQQHERYGSFCFGNLLEHDFEEIAARVESSKLYADIKEGIRQCREACAYYGVCGGGAPSNKIYENGSAASTETVYCRAYMRGIDAVLDLMERIPQDLNTTSARPSTPVPGLCAGISASTTVTRATTRPTPTASGSSSRAKSAASPSPSSASSDADPPSSPSSVTSSTSTA